MQMFQPNWIGAKSVFLMEYPKAPSLQFDPPDAYEINTINDVSSITVYFIN